ncbi:hypothetical protein ACFWP2_12580 [Kitasatospora sp. NPDC058444]|uniref:hypothetical protein n=1 Tax=Kitasatospora sp. NPDC058444 TaxID=3346504 RepID=UPI0036522EF6
MPLSTIRRATTARTLAGTVLTVALLVPAATACSSASDTHDSAAPTATAPVSTPAATPAATTPATTPAATGTPGTPGTRGATAPAAAPTGPAATKPTTPPKAASGVRTEALVDGSTAEIRDLGNQHYVARILNKGQVLATLETKEHDAGLDANGMFVMLSLDGRIHSWMGGSHQGPGTFKLAGGWTAKVTKTGELRYRAEILGNENAVYGTLEANQQDAGVDANGISIVLSAGGEISAHE